MSLGRWLLVACFSDSILAISDPSASNFSQFFGFQDSPNLSTIEKVAENRDFVGKETLIVKSAIPISKRVLG